LRYWKPFPDTVAALRLLRERHRLAIISNVDDGLFALTSYHLDVECDWIITAEQARTYRPSLNDFEVALPSIGVAPEKLVFDRWASRAAYEAFLVRWISEYRRLDHQVEELTEEETPLGAFEVLS
jgi:hypothetical protein